MKKKKQKLMIMAIRELGRLLVGNIVEDRFYGEEKEVTRGTKKFSPGAKVYCFPALR